MTIRQFDFILFDLFKKVIYANVKKDNLEDYLRFSVFI